MIGTITNNCSTTSGVSPQDTQTFPHMMNFDMSEIVEQQEVNN